MDAMALATALMLMAHMENPMNEDTNVIKPADSLAERLRSLARSMRGELPDFTLAELMMAAEQSEALYALHHAVCGETGFANAVRVDSGLAYPWPALDEADMKARISMEEFHG